MNDCSTRSDSLFSTDGFGVLQNCWLKRSKGRRGGHGRKRKSNNPQPLALESNLDLLDAFLNRLGRKLGHTAKPRRHERARAAAPFKARQADRALKDELFFAQDEGYELDGTTIPGAGSALCPYLGIALDANERGFVTDDDSTYIQVVRDGDGRITGAFARPRGRYYD